MEGNDVDKTKIDGYLRRLIEIDSNLNNEEDLDQVKIDEINSILVNLNNDINKSAQNIYDMKVRFKKLHKDAVIPTYSKPGDAGLDLTITDIKSETEDEIIYGFGIALEIPKHYVGLVIQNQSIVNYDLSMKNAIDVIVSGDHGEIIGKFRKHKSSLGRILIEKYKIGDRALQIIIIPYPSIQFIECDELSETERGDVSNKIK